MKDNTKKHRFTKYVWTVKNGDEVVFEGFIRDVADFFNLDFKYVQNCYYQGKKIQGRYTLENRPCIPEDFYKYEKSPDDIRFEEILHDIKYYGNTITTKEPTKLIKRLAGEGIDVTSRYVPKQKLKPMTAYDVPTTSEEFWVLENRNV